MYETAPQLHRAQSTFTLAAPPTWPEPIPENPVSQLRASFVQRNCEATAHPGRDMAASVNWGSFYGRDENKSPTTFGGTYFGPSIFGNSHI